MLLRRLAVFAGGWTLDAAEAICAGEGIAEEEVLELLAGLVNKSLVLLEEERTGARYRLLETVRQYGREKLVAAGEEPPVQDRHLDWYLTLAKQAEARIGGPEQEVWLARLEVELENLRAALTWSSVGEGRQETGLRLAESLRWFWVVCAHLSEGQRWLEDLLKRDIAAALRARSLDALGELVRHQGQYERALALFEESFVLHTEAGNRAGAAHALLAQGMVTISLGGYQRATALIQEALPLLRDQGERHGVGWSLGFLGVIVHRQGQHAQAAAYHEQSLAIFQELGDRFGSGQQLAHLATVARDLGNYERAKHLYRESLRMRRALLDRRGFAECFEGLAATTAAERQWLRAARLFGAAHGLREAVGSPIDQVNRAAYDRTVADVHAALGDDAFAAAWAVGHAMGLEEAIVFALQKADPA
jgi:non-specific serine/threonine protein kinase